MNGDEWQERTERDPNDPLENLFDEMFDQLKVAPELENQILAHIAQLPEPRGGLLGRVRNWFLKFRRREPDALPVSQPVIIENGISAPEVQGSGWSERLRQVLTEMAGHGQEFESSVALWVQRLAQATESQVEAAVEVTFDATRQASRVLFEPVQECLRPGVTLQYSPAAGALRGPVGHDENQMTSTGVFLSPAIPGARVVADVSAHTIFVEFQELPAPVFVILIPDDSSSDPRLFEMNAADSITTVRFDNVSPGRYLLSMYVQTPEPPEQD